MLLPYSGGNPELRRQEPGPSRAMMVPTCFPRLHDLIEYAVLRLF